MVKKPSAKSRKTTKKAAKNKAAPAPKLLRDQTPNLGDDFEAMKVRRMPKSAAASMPMEESVGGRRAMAAVGGWRIAASLEKLRRQINAKAPNRSKVSDGGIGDAAHRSRRSDHNPWVREGRMGIVTARDFTHDAGHGCSGEKLAESIRAARDKRVKYIIWNRRICWSVAKNGRAPWAWRRYTGKNGHTQHVHISVKPLKSLYDDQGAWSLSLM
jgi:hypothetical protein